MDDEEFRRLLEEREADTYKDAKEVMDEEWEFMRKNWFNYITAAALGFTAVAVVVAMFLTMMSWIYN